MVTDPQVTDRMQSAVMPIQSAVMIRERSTPSRDAQVGRLSALALVLSCLASTGAALTTQEVAAPILRPMAEAEQALQRTEPHLAESLYRTALQEGWMLLGALDVAKNDLEAARSA